MSSGVWWRKSAAKNIAVGAASLCIASAISYTVFQFSESKTWTKFQMSYRKEPIPLVKLDRVPYVPSRVALDVIRKGFDNKFGGIAVIFAPTGSGKTTYLAKIADEYKRSGRNVKFISCVANKQHLYDTLGVPKMHYNLSEVIPDQTVVILDQMESVVFGEELKSMLREIALDSRKIKNYTIIVSVSAPEVAQSILSLNGNDKISSLGSASDFRWSREMVSSYVEQSQQYTGWSDVDKMKLVALAVTAGSPGFLFSLENLDKPTPSSVLDSKKVRSMANSYAAAWSSVDRELE